MSVAADVVAVVYETIVDLPLRSSYGRLGDSSLRRGTNLNAHWQHTWPPIVIEAFGRGSFSRSVSRADFMSRFKRAATDARSNRGKRQGV